MGAVERREFLKMAAGGTVATIAATALPMVGILEWVGQDRLTFRAAVGMPRNPLPAYASFVIDGNVDLSRGTGVIRKSLYAGAPDSMSNILFPGTSRVIRVTRVQRSGQTINIAGEIDPTETLGPRETRNASIVIDMTKKTAQADFFGRPVTLRVQ